MRVLVALLLLTSIAQAAEKKVIILETADQQKLARVAIAAGKLGDAQTLLDAADVLRLLIAAGTLQEPPISPEPPKEEPK